MFFILTLMFSVILVLGARSESQKQYIILTTTNSPQSGNNNNFNNGPPQPTGDLNLSEIPSIEKLVNLTELQMYYSLDYQKLHVIMLEKSFKEKLSLVEFIQKSTERKHQETNDILNRLIALSNRTKNCVVFFRPKILDLSFVSSNIANCIETAIKRGSSLLKDVNEYISGAETAIYEIRPKAVTCIKNYANATEFAFECTVGLIDKQSEQFQAEIDNIAVELEKISSDSMFYAKQAQGCVYMQSANHIKSIEVNLSEIRTCTKTNNTLVARETVERLLSSIYKTNN